MERIYTANNPPEAHLLRGYLEAAGLHAVVQGEGAFGIRGGLPATSETLPSVWVPSEEVEQALELVEQFFAEETPVEAEETWTCPSCGEVLGGQFTACWNCGSERTDLAE